MQGMFLHVLADTMGSVAVIVSALLIKNFGWHWTDPLSSLILSILIFASIYPVLKDSACILLQRCPPKIERELPAAFQKVRARVTRRARSRRCLSAPILPCAGACAVRRCWACRA